MAPSWESTKALARWIRPVRNGLSPASAFRMRRGTELEGRFKGVPFRAGNGELLGHLALTVWSGEYDAPGFVPGPGDRVVDVGANIGAFAVLSASRGATVTAYEPHPTTFTHLRANVNSWGAQSHQAAVVPDAASATAALWLHPERNTRHSLFNVDVASGSRLTEAIDVPAVSLAETIDGGCDLLKLDCEGAEFPLLLETEDAALERVGRIVSEVHTTVGDPAQLCARLEELGFATSYAPIQDGTLGRLFARRAD